MKKIILVIILLITAAIGSCILLFHIINQQIVDGMSNPPSLNYVEEDMEIYLLTTGLGCDDYVLYKEDRFDCYALYFMRRLGEERYYFVIYKFNEKSKKYEYKYYVEVNREEYLKRLKYKNF